MKKWAKSTKGIIDFAVITAHPIVKAHEIDVVQIADSECDGEIIRIGYHDGTALFTQELVDGAFGVLVATKTAKIGTVKLETDFVICDMKYGKNARAQRDRITIPFQYEDELSQ